MMPYPKKRTPAERKKMATRVAKTKVAKKAAVLKKMKDKK